MKCTQCEKKFELPEWEIKRGRGKYCSRECFYASRVGKSRPEIQKRTIKKCIACGKKFETGGRAGDKDKKYCSLVCLGYGLVHTAKVNQMTVAEAAYFAGLMDGEGSVTAARIREKRTTWRISISNTDFELLEWCNDITGCGSIIRHKNTNPKWADGGTWQCYSWNARDILKQILIYMRIPEKIRRANLMIAELDTIENNNSLTVSAGG